MAFATVTAPPRPVSPDRTTIPKRSCSPLNPLSRPQPLKPTTTTTTTISTRQHLSNLNRFLDSQHPPLPSQPLQPSLPFNDSLPLDPDPHVPRPPGLFHAINVPFLFPSFRRSAEDIDMSPRSLSHLQRLLSDSPRPSPKTSISSQWQDFHGRRNWAGLLDPLDENLRRELLRCGDFVTAAYNAFHSNPSSPRPLLLPDRSYRVTKSLHVTSSLDFPSWALPLAPAPWMAERSSWAGYVAVCDNEREIQRMGRRDIVIALRGTATCLEWAENFRAGLVTVSDDSSVNPSSQRAAKVERGFWNLFNTPGSQVSSLADAVVKEVRRLMDKYAGEELSITVTGHSLGAALALLVADELSSAVENAPPIAVFSFGGPRVGNKAFADRVEEKRVKVLRVVNAHDVITKVPGVLPSHVRGEDAYADVGVELRVDSRASPYLKPNADVACCHDLEAYLHLVDGFMGTGCPFRANAKRSIAKLMDQQRANMRGVFVAKARQLGLGSGHNPARKLSLGPLQPVALARSNSNVPSLSR
ncbi:LOW QUALITY PROTEIN: phospholipase A1-Ibeta2, chloroplastic [Dioscorea cayenensis subsp. rotundata]|uniref:LOW QUALITY PROTEIN: phospholipase A1-Ibeta2, chloroplastic n=1 Tax=Dioscorea cayennensis subsp. rotundata TaxID=55577 RepID=A0AB40B1D7_DIOCR|nr:LOW QUALITY PROTEIN: phospholipase A1-Ibeta2, chloroplastic [Dioscorea cayenensis subsp. rotundata]